MTDKHIFSNDVVKSAKKYVVVDRSVMNIKFSIMFEKRESEC